LSVAGIPPGTTRLRCPRPARRPGPGPRGQARGGSTGRSARA
jgi:hypothetical protein